MKRKSLILHLFLIIFCNFWLLSGWANASQSPNLWDVLRKQFKLNHETTRTEVQTQIRWITAHPSYIQKLSQAEPYIYHIVTELKKRNLPGEIALIPMIESTYDPFAYSGAGAAGLWQLMPGTGTDLGLKRDWWFDGRRSIRPSTDAALNYLAYLHKFFHGDWILAFAAYDSGEGTMSRLIKRSRFPSRANFWSLPVPRETKAYIPRLLALAAVIQNPQRYHVKLPNIPHMPYFQEVNVGSQIDLEHAAKLADIPYKELIKLNPGYNRWATAPYSPYKLLIPVAKVEHFIRNLARFPKEKRVSWTRHQVSSGETLSVIARRYHTTVELLKELNQLKSTNTVKKGQFILVPNTHLAMNQSKNKNITSNLTSQKATYINTQQYKLIHIVQKKDNFKALQHRYGVSEAEIRHWNIMAPHMPLRPGQQLIIWRKHFNPLYIVKSGDNLSKIAKLNHIPLTTIKHLNPHLKNILKPGQEIRIA